ncbi:MAG: helix-turn-helix transcriptional regulator [Firmicutes bacterium]|nr:helix-turn-helix transcriptional regulator [Bacillota bacterium]
MLNNLKYLRQLRNMSQQELAEIAGCSQQAIDKYENGLAEPGLETLIKLSDVFDVSIDYLIGKTSNPYLDKKPYFSELNDEEARLVRNYRLLKEDEKKVIYSAVNQYKKYSG